MRLFDFHRPTTVTETLDLRTELGDEAELLAGGTSLINMAKLGLAEPEHVISLSGVPELHGVAGSPADGLTFGAMTTIRDVETSPLVRDLAPGLGEAASHVATVRIRNQATLGGNLVHADPNQDLPPMLMVHEAVARLRGPDGVREVPVTDLFVGFFQTVLGEDEILESVHVPAAPAGLRTGYLKFLPRTKDDYPTVSVAAGVTVVDGRFTDARLAIAGGGSTTLRCRAAEEALVGAHTGEAALAAAADALTEALDPVSDGRGSSRYKTEMARVCTRRLLQRLATEAYA
ncbi:MAG: xanthine dehydrogenase family protein subunit M [Actinomycetota bacterium]|nr:xanthine dehydrogenase family protein subunit M [Actinomycetota bacterium]